VGDYVNKYGLDNVGDDILQDASCAILETIDKYNPKKSKLSTFMYVCIQNMLRRWKIKSKTYSGAAYIPWETWKLLKDVNGNSEALYEKNLTESQRIRILSALSIHNAVYYDGANRALMAQSIRNGTEVRFDTDVDSIDNHVVSLNEYDSSGLEAIKALLESVSKLSKADQELLKYRFVDGLDFRVIAKKFKLTCWGVRLRTKVIIKKLRESLLNQIQVKPYSRACPTCLEVITYRTPKSCNEACQRNKSCHRCAQLRIKREKIICQK
jgi:RNA polymerase sigma factor (sigma-70 family)